MGSAELICQSGVGWVQVVSSELRISLSVEPELLNLIYHSNNDKLAMIQQITASSMYAGREGRSEITARANTVHGTHRVLTAPLYERPGHRSRTVQQEYSKDAVRAQQQCSKGTAERNKESQHGHCDSMVKTKKTEQASVNCGETYRCACERQICLDEP